MKTEEERVILLDNLHNRMEYDENYNRYKLSGAITKAEHDALYHAIEIYRKFSQSG